MARITLRLPEPLHAALTARSRTRGKSMNELVVEALAESLGEELQPAGDERSRLLAALGDLAWDGWDIPDPENDKVPLLTHEELSELIGPIDPPLSERIITDREDRF